MQPQSSLSRSLQIQTRVVGALIMREVITRYGRHNIGFLWLFLEPMLFTLGITTLWTLLKATHGSNLPITAFAVTGYSSLILWRNCSNRAVKAIDVNLALLYHRNVRAFDVIATRIILEIVGATSSLIVLTITFSAVGLMSFPVDILTILIGWFLLCWFAFALSLVVGALSERSETIERVWHIITYLMFPLSGAAFMVDWLPEHYRQLISWVPMVHGTEMIRHGYFGAAVHTHEEPWYLATFNAVLLLIGLALVRETGRRVEPE
ncbi:ABC transporter permease [Caballeronia sp. dw_19]|uniref:ABC transporter permease n=1 Tax=Caballeronia sp. dw_19 TaxID=2719791 RepID=UPI001BD4F703|nr:ABC transporter permease [Caballeronia sp. dw_19]